MAGKSWNCVCFDLDGTLTDPKPGITGCIRYALERLGHQPPPADALTWCIGPPLLGSFQTLLGNAEQAAEALALYRERFGTVGLFENAVYPGVEAALASCRDAGYRMFVATSKPTVYAERIVAHFGLASYFEAVVGSELDGTRADKTALLAWLLDRYGVAAETAIMIGDRQYDVIGARNNGMASIGVTYGYGNRTELVDAGAGWIVDRPADIPAVLSDKGVG